MKRVISIVFLLLSLWPVLSASTSPYLISGEVGGGHYDTRRLDLQPNSKVPINLIPRNKTLEIQITNNRGEVLLNKTKIDLPLNTYITTTQESINYFSIYNPDSFGCDTAGWSLYIDKSLIVENQFTNSKSYTTSLIPLSKTQNLETLTPTTKSSDTIIILLSLILLTSALFIIGYLTKQPIKEYSIKIPEDIKGEERKMNTKYSKWEGIKEGMNMILEISSQNPYYSRLSIIDRERNFKVRVKELSESKHLAYLEFPSELSIPSGWWKPSDFILKEVIERHQGFLFRKSKTIEKQEKVKLKEPENIEVETKETTKV